MRVGIPLAVVLLSLGLATAGPAVAAPGNGVHVDPGSPAGKQYAIPIPSARSETSGQTGNSGSGSSNPPLFGVGVTPSASAAVAAGGSGSTGQAGRGSTARGGEGTARTRAAGRSRGGGTGGSSATDSSGSASRTGHQTAAESNSVGGTSWLPLLGGGALVLLVGCGGGYFLRRSL